MEEVKERNWQELYSIAEEAIDNTIRQRKLLRKAHKELKRKEMADIRKEIHIIDMNLMDELAEELADGDSAGGLSHD